MTLKKSLLIALLSFGIANAAFAENDTLKNFEAIQYINQQNYTAAFPLFKELAEKGYPSAQFNLALMYERGQGVTKNGKQAVHWYEKAAKQGYVDAQFNLALMYYKGKDVAQNYKQAIHWYEKAAKQGYAGAQYNLALIYGNGLGVRRDFDKAKYYLVLACNGGKQEACDLYKEVY